MTETTDPCPMEAVFGPDDRVPCLLGRGHEPPHQYTPEGCGECGCDPRNPRCPAEESAPAAAGTEPADA